MEAASPSDAALGRISESVLCAEKLRGREWCAMAAAIAAAEGPPSGAGAKAEDDEDDDDDDGIAAP
jgi:hypothetical protein